MIQLRFVSSNHRFHARGYGIPKSGDGSGNVGLDFVMEVMYTQNWGSNFLRWLGFTRVIAPELVGAKTTNNPAQISLGGFWDRIIYHLNSTADVTRNLISWQLVRLQVGVVSIWHQLGYGNQPFSFKSRAQRGAQQSIRQHFEMSRWQVVVNCWDNRMYKKNVHYDWQRETAFWSGELLDKDNVISSIESSHKSDPESANTNSAESQFQRRVTSKSERFSQ